MRPQRDGEGAPQPRSTEGSTLEITRYLERIRENDAGALADLLDRYLPVIETWVRRERGDLVRSGFETVDCVQDVALDLVRYLPNVEVANTEAFRGLVYRMIQNSLRNKYHYLQVRRRSLAREDPLGSDTVLRLDAIEESAAGPITVLDEREKQAWIRFALALMDPDDQVLLMRRIYDGESFPRLAEELAIEPDAARMRFNRAKAKLYLLIGRLRRGRLEELCSDADAQG